MLILVENVVSDHRGGPHLTGLIHHWVESHHPDVEKLLWQELLEHVSIDLLLVLYLGWGVSVQVMCL